MAVKRIVAARELATVLALAAPARADAAGKRITTTEAARRRFVRGTAVDVRHRLARAPLSCRWMVIFVRATVVDSAVSGDNDDCYIVRYPACSATAPSGRIACVPAEDVREVRRAPSPAAAKRPSPESSTETADGASCKKAKMPGQGIPMAGRAAAVHQNGGDGSKKTKMTGKGIPLDALRRFFEEHEKEEEEEAKKMKAREAGNTTPNCGPRR